MKFLDHDPTRHENLKLTGKGIFENIPAGELEELREAGEWAWATEDELILETEQEQEHLYVVIQGSVHVFRKHFRSGREHPLADLFEGECFGEMAFFGEGKATANVKAKERSLLWRLSHENLMEYLNEYKGAGQMCLNLAAILAHRLKEGNTRLNGLAGGLSTYFGLKSQLLGQEVETPVSGDPAEFELPPSIMDSFVRETLRLPSGDEVLPEQTALVQDMLENEKVDLVRWLEDGASGHRLKLKLHFVEVDREGRDIHTRETTGTDSTIRVSEAPTTATPAKSKIMAKHIAGTLSKKGRGKRSTRGTAKKPRVDTAKKKPRPLMPEEEEEPSLLKQLLFPAACAFFIFLLVLIVILVIPGPTKAGWVQNEEGDINGFMRSVLFPTSKLPAFGKESKDWQNPFTWNLSERAREKGWLYLQLELKKPIVEDTELLLELINPDGKNKLTGKYSKKKVLLGKDQKRWEILNMYIDEGDTTDLVLQMEIDHKANQGEEWETAKVKLHVFR